jgi:hypothetical protein
MPDVDQQGSLYHNAPPTVRRAQVVQKWGITPEHTDLPGIHYISNRSGNLPGFLPPLQQSLKRGCVRPFRTFNVNWKGDGILCCNDYHGEVTLGNVLTQGVEAVWNDVRHHIFRLKLQNRDRDIALCDVCDFAGGVYTHLVQKVTFGSKLDKEILAADLSTMKEVNALARRIKPRRPSA